MEHPGLLFSGLDTARALFGSLDRQRRPELIQRVLISYKIPRKLLSIKRISVLCRRPITHLGLTHGWTRNSPGVVPVMPSGRLGRTLHPDFYQPRAVSVPQIYLPVTIFV